MSKTIKLSTAAMIGGALLLSGCASTGAAPTMPNQGANGYQLPQSISDGYWAMTEKMSGQATVISFKNGKTYNYRFNCGVNGSYQQAGQEVYNLVPHPNSVGLQYGNEPEFSTIKVVNFKPKQSLTLNQMFNAPDLKQAYPNGQNYSYVYKSQLQPICR
ncbi:hypothetical protein [Psychrobacter sp. FDAARGOS_221]|uniref:hypothetical protein n=1 Tax=Psychrobacter sp. FDAARGOS_221 TaxID=1975705 RepID=UPI000BB593AB|nr:hypothetical protein [Psychrobacter sp. FDAARGOS_221]PNK60972.1 hypothetical protein A6J60_008815 [Psychrobacter sp. FDAARGOS_221]